MSKKVRILMILLLVAVAAFGFFKLIPRPKPIEPEDTTIEHFVKQGELSFVDSTGQVISDIDIEIADTDMTREKGLMNRGEMASNQGMLFLFDSTYVQTFWMKNTILSLDIIFVDDTNRIVHIAETTTPFSEDMISSIEPARFVVEVNAGYCAQHNIKKGDSIRWRRIQ